MADPDSRFGPEIIEELLDQLRDGKSMREICADSRMPGRETIRRWAEKDDELGASIAQAREVGYHERAERAVEAAKTADDAAKGRLAFDAERWHLSKLSRAFGDKVDVRVGELDGLTDEQLERRYRAIAGQIAAGSAQAGDGAATPESAA